MLSICVVFFNWYPAISMIMFSPSSSFFVQLICGLNAWNHGCPRMRQSLPKLATKNRCFFFSCPFLTYRLQYFVMVLAWFSVPSTFCTVLGCCSKRVPIPSFSRVQASMKFSVAPQSSRASTLVFLCHMCRSMGTVIESSLMLYMELISALSMTVRTQHFKNPPLPYHARQGRPRILLRSCSSRLLQSAVLWRVGVLDFRLCLVCF